MSTAEGGTAPPFERVLVANRGEIACRVLATLDRLGIGGVAVFAEADRASRHVDAADVAVSLGDGPVATTYLDGAAIIDAALRTGAQAVHPGYGFLSERAEVAETIEAAGLTFIGPTPDQLRRFGTKHTARALAEAAGVPLLAGSGLLGSLDEARTAAERVGYPVVVKSSAGGGGIGMEVCRAPDELAGALDRVRRAGEVSFGSGDVFLEHFVARARHVEVQVFGDGAGRVRVLGDRDCSAQRRNQKVLEEAPAPHLPEATRRAMADSAAALAASVDYRSAGTVEFVVDADTGEPWFLEVNTRLQVEHGVTEAIYGIDLVEWMVRVAAGDTSPLDQPLPEPGGHALEARLYAERPEAGFRPSTGLLTAVSFPDDVRVDTWVEAGTEVTPFYDPLLAKVVVHGTDRADAVRRMARALAATRLDGIETNLGFLASFVATPAVVDGSVTTSSLETADVATATIEVLEPGNLTTVQDLPGRLGYWAVGVPPSGPMDDRSFRLGNAVVGNAPGTAGLELTVVGPSLRFAVPTTVCLAGADLDARLDGRPVPRWTPAAVPAGGVLEVGTAAGPGCRGYLLVRGGIDVPPYLGSRSTFTLGRFGGHGGRALRAGDVLPLGDPALAPHPSAALADDQVPVLGHHWDLGVVPGPHVAPDYFTADDIEVLESTDWEVHHNSARTGVRLVGPKPTWARSDGGEAGLHPSNIHDNAYAVGTVDFTGDMPIILGPDGPSLGGFVCPATVVAGERWKLGQLRPGDTVRFVPVDDDEADRLAGRSGRADASAPAIDVGVGPGGPDRGPRPATARPAAVLAHRPADAARPELTCRRAGDEYLLVEYGPNVLDLDLRFRVHALMAALDEEAPAGIVDLTPGIRSLQVHVDRSVLDLDRVLAHVLALDDDLGDIADLEVPSRIVRLPLSWDDPATLEATRRYEQTVRDDAPWCPHNLEFIRRINGLAGVEDVHRIVFDASYLVLGLGDVYLGAPVATPVDPRHRLVTTKYNPARTWTPENAVGIGGAYLCIYGMEGPGGYQFVGRTVPVWNRWRTTGHFEPGHPWLLRFFDQIRWYEVSTEELADLRRDLVLGRVELDVEATTFSLAEHRRFLADQADDIARAKARQQEAFDAERARWAASGELEAAERAAAVAAGAVDVAGDDDGVPEGAVAVRAPTGASVWQVAVEPGSVVAAGDPLVVLEAMKMETALVAPVGGTVAEVRCVPGRVVAGGQVLVVLDPDADDP